MRITTRTLRETKLLVSLRDRLGLEVDEETLLALADRAWSEGKNPGALFRWMLGHPESWKWLSDDDRARARRRIQKDLRRQERPAIGRRTHIDSIALALKRPHRVFQPPPPSTGWQAEAARIAGAHDENMRRHARNERWGRAVNFAIIAGVLAWLFL